MADGDDKGGTGSAGGSGGGGGSSERTFTQADMERLISDRLGRERAKFADYDDLKRKAGEADKTKSDVDKLTDAVKALTDRAERAERDNLRREVADRLKLPKSFAAKLTGATKEDLEREAREMVDELKALGVKFDDDKGGSNGAGDGGGQGDAGSGNGSGGDGATGAGQGDGGAGASGGNGGGNSGGTRGGRPKETLHSGANPSGGGDNAEDPSKLADQILSSRF